jgi:predicted transcriptional regulator
MGFFQSKSFSYETVNKAMALDMRRSKLEMYIDMLQILAQWGPLKLTHIMYKANLNSIIAKEQLDFLLQKGLIEERLSTRGVVFNVTQSGLTIVKYFREVKKALPIIEENRSGFYRHF